MSVRYWLSQVDISSKVDKVTGSLLITTAELANANANNYPQTTTSATSGTITLDTNKVTVLTTTLTNAHTLAITQGNLLADFANEFVAIFSIGATVPNLTFTPPAGVTYIWVGGTAPIPAINKTYLFSWVRISDTSYLVNYQSN